MWLNTKKIRPYRGRLLARLERVKNGNFGDFKLIEANLFELRFFFGSGFRIYYTVKDKQIILLLVGGDKASQKNDIKIVKTTLNELE